MKKIIYIFILCCLSISVAGQSKQGLGSSFKSSGNNSRNSQQDSVPESNVEHFHRTWQWAHDGVYKNEVAIDTSLDKIHNYNYIFQKSIANTYLANFPSPYISDIYVNRADDEDFFALTNIRAFLFKPVDALEYNTTTPFTQLKYFSGGGKKKNETLLDVFHTQNITPFWNAGLRYNLISSDGRYMNQKAKAYNFSIFSSYERERIAATFFLNQNNGKFNENGGITDRNLLEQDSLKAEDLPVYLSNTTNSYRNFNFYGLFQYNIGKKKEVIEAKDTSYTYPAKAVFSATIEDNVHRFKEGSINKEFFPVSHIDSVSGMDFQGNRVYNLTSKFIVNEHPKHKYLPGVYAGLNFKYLDYSERKSLDSTHYKGTSKYTGTWLTGGIFNVDKNAVFNFDVSGKLCLLGDYVGNFELQGFIRQYFNKEKNAYVKVDFLADSKAVNHFFTRYIGNHDIWDNNFKNIKRLNIEGRYVNPKLRTELGVAWANTIDYVYFDTTAMPEQTSKAVMVFSAWAKQVFRAGNFYFDQTVYVQKSTQEDILSLPTLAVYSHNYYQNAFFQKVLKFVVGIDFFYNTKFYADKYRPSTMQFYNQREEKTGGYPKLDVFLDFSIKRAHLFLKYEHVSYYLTNGGYFSALDYPINPPMFKFGLRWNFFN